MLDLTKLTIFFGIINPTYLGGFQTLKIHCKVVVVDRFFVVGLINFMLDLTKSTTFLDTICLVNFFQDANKTF